ncbi:uncharacterized protein PITG_06940 [Phytophthora infestans T30-4]|uniref:Fe2OG dioxygenase domain-containing protein n=1 Tax=Phytophthora infestans (strain T30-4) TaxID=403677 RepID=D0N6V0_PHYIT|nr:uncharacterized protein PITG_06940 [Phytophthora infestans T30-4]EEY53299.1 conserved hypothetical protein [Phytophthora infestans T30-4]|eukprot:XP_002904917.1 conserved hypothetical protein [Phytophthora infestans T30-4]
MLSVSRRLLPRLRNSPFSSLQSPAPAQNRVNTNWEVSVTSDLVSGLLGDGYYVVRDAFPVDDQLYPNSTHILLNDADNGNKLAANTLLLEKHDIFETELALDAIRDQSSVPFLRDFFEQQVVFGSLHQALPGWLGLAGHMVKVQHNAGRGCFPMHFDTYGGDGKCVTAVLYLNEEWKPEDGGEIVLYPFPKSRVVVQPRFGELVLFSSQQMLHRVMPATKPRYALTTWMKYQTRGTQRSGPWSPKYCDLRFVDIL